jgi:hypothetical protein
MRRATGVLLETGMRVSSLFAACCVIALAGCPVVDLGDDPPDIGRCHPLRGFKWFQDQIWPMYLHPADPAKNCAQSAGCHALTHGLALDPNAMNLDGNYAVTLGYVNCGSPMSSPLLTRPLANIDGHGGGDIFQDLNDPAVKLFLQWFEPEQ